MADRESLRPGHVGSSRDVAGEDFLFHLYRGSELLQDNRVHDAKAELEQALALQPSDPKGQDLLGIVYFRLGMYPRAISIYERLIQMHPGAIEPRINLALSYLKTGQPAQARIELEKVLEQNPNHGRAWGYLGLAFQRLGDLERAGHAFAAGGHDAMAKRVLEMAAGGQLSLRPEPLASSGRTEVRKAAGEAFHELDRTDVGFQPDADLPRIPSGMWSATEPGREPLPTTAGSSSSANGPNVTSSAPTHQMLDRGHTAAAALAQAAADGAAAATSPADAPRAEPPLVVPRTFTLPASSPSIRSGPGHASPPAKATQLARDMLLVFPRDLPVALHTTGLVLVQTQSGFVTRLDAVRSLAYPSGFTTAVLHRRTRGKAVEEPLGGASSPLFEITGRGELILGPNVGQRLTPLSLEDDPLYLREEAVCAFELSVNYENGRLPVGDGEAVAMLQLRGPGTVVATLPLATSTVEVTEARSAAVRALAVLGWMGRVVPRALLPSEAPAGARGFVSFAGEGMVLLDAR